MHDAYVGGRSENNIKYVPHDDLGWTNRTTLYNCRFSAASLALWVIFSVSQLWNVFSSFTEPLSCSPSHSSSRSLCVCLWMCMNTVFIIVYLILTAGKVSKDSLMVSVNRVNFYYHFCYTLETLHFWIHSGCTSGTVFMKSIACIVCKLQHVPISSLYEQFNGYFVCWLYSNWCVFCSFYVYAVFLLLCQFSGE